MLDVIVIGAGPGGLVCTKELLEAGLRVVCLERAAVIGGAFATAYDDLVLTSSATMSMFSDFWIGDGNQHAFWTKDEALDYWRRYAAHFGVLDHLRLNTTVRTVSPKGQQGWEVELESGETLVARRIALAIGNNSIPRHPAWKDELSAVDALHSKDYRNAERFAGKRVLVVGGGESGSDVALQIARVASQCWLSLRETTGWVIPRTRGDRAADISTHRGVYGLPREYGAHVSKVILETELLAKDPVFDAVVELNRKVTSERGIWGTFWTKTLGIPEAMVRHACKVVGEIVGVEAGGKTLRTADGTTLEGVDAVVFCTGYKNEVAFLPQEWRACDPRSLYKHMFHPELRDRIAWIGWARPAYGSQFPVMELQARYFALICKGERVLPAPADMERIINADGVHNLEQFGQTAHRLRSLVDYAHYMDDMARLIGCEPPLQEYILSSPHLWLRMMYGAIQGTQFRLRGPGNKEALARSILSKLPVSRFNHIVKAGLRGRLIYGLQNVAPSWLSRPLIQRLAGLPKSAGASRATPAGAQ